MAYIDYITFADASPDLQELYTKHGGGSKTPANIVRVSGVNPPVLKAHYDLYRAIMYGPSPLSRHQREMIAVLVSALNHCHY